jgi:hypothetical protein
MFKPNPDLSERVVRVVDYQTSPQQPDRCSEHVVVRTLASAGCAPGRIREELSAAVERGDLDTDGERYWLPARI